MKLNELSVGECAKIKKVGGRGALRQHFLDMGILPKAELQFVKTAPMGDPLEFNIHGYELTLRKDDAAKIEIEKIPELTKVEKPKSEKVFHPGYGEGGIFHDGKHEHPLPNDTILTYALVGNQNCGKTTLFNRLTGSNQHVGNFPGVTVDRKDGVIIGHPNTRVTDLPGIYSMSPYSSEELISRNFVLDEKPKAIINIVDASNIERNLYLTMQLLEMEVPVVIALNMMDEVTGNGGSIDINAMENFLGVPVVPISASKNQGIEELIKHAIHIAHYQEKPSQQDFCNPNDNNGAVHRARHSIYHLIEDHAKKVDIPGIFAASKIIEGDSLIIQKLGLDENEKEAIEHIVLQMENECGLDRSAAIAEMRFSFISKMCAHCVTKPKESKERIRSEKLDKIFTGKFTAIPTFIVIMLLIFYLTFNVIGAFFQDLLDKGITYLTNITDGALTQLDVNQTLHSLIIDGIFSGVGSVLSFLPIIVILFLFLSLLEDSGYIARVAFVMDKLLRKIGLSGRSIVPMLIGFGCSVPAIMSTRTLPSERDRKMTILLTPFMSCSAKLPIYAFFTSAFFPGKGGLVMTCLYLFGILNAILVALIYRRTLFKGEAVPFVMELPNYRLPSARNVLQLLWEKAKDFIVRAFSIILIATVVVWFLQTFDIHFNLVQNSSDSIMAKISGIFVPLFKPIGLGDWRICTSLISGFMAKESVVATMELLFGTAGIEAFFTTSTVIIMLVYSLIYTPCVATIAAVKNELGLKWAFGIVVFQCVFAWIVCYIIKLIMLLFGII